MSPRGLEPAPLTLLHTRRIHYTMTTVVLLMGEPFLTEFFFPRYKGNDGQDLLELRHNTFMRFAATATTAIKPQSLPPTERAAYFHSLRVHLQVIEWKSLMRVTLPAVDWGWKLQHGMYEPVMTDLAPAPQKILKFVRCNCKLMGKNVCGTNACTCRKTGLLCISACGQCYGKNCHNANDDTDVNEISEDLNIYEIP